VLHQNNLQRPNTVERSFFHDEETFVRFLGCRLFVVRALARTSELQTSTERAEARTTNKYPAAQEELDESG
jgi:hypothetical protein